MLDLPSPLQLRHRFPGAPWQELMLAPTQVSRPSMPNCLE